MMKSLVDSDAFYVTHWSFVMIGVDPRSPRILQRPLICLALHVASFSFVVLGLDKIFESEHAVDMILMSVLSQLVIALWKMLIFFYKRREIQKLILYFERWQDTEVNSDELNMYRKYGSKISKIHKFYYASVFFAGLSGMLRPLMTKGFLYVRGIDYPWETPHDVNFPWDISTAAGFISAFTWNTMMLYFLLNASVAMDTLFLWFTLNVLMQFRTLNQRFHTAAELNRGMSSREDVIANIKYHVDILKTVKSLDQIFAEIIFVKSLISGGQICFLTYSMASGHSDTSIYNVMYLGSFLVAVAVQLLLYCYSGQLITDESLMVSKEIFEAFHWQLLEKPTKKMLQMTMLRSQRSCVFTGILFNLNLKLYLWFFKTAASLISVLKAMDE